MGRFSVFRRSNSKYFYAQLKNPETGRYLPAKSTGQTEKSEALLVVAEWMKNGLPENGEGHRAIRDEFALDTILHRIQETELTTNDAKRILTALQSQGLIESAKLAGSGEDTENLLSFLYRFWDYGESPYVREKLAYGHSIGRRHCYEQAKRLHHWRDFFGENTDPRDVTRDQLKEFQLYLKDKGLAAKTVNMIVAAGTVALGWLAEQGVLGSDPAAGLRKFSGRPKQRGILTPEQVQSLFAVDWPDNRARVGNLVAMTTGLRSGEVIALRLDDVGEDRVYVCSSWSFADGLKKPKNGEERDVPLLSAIRCELLQLAAQNPHGDNGFLFYHAEPDRPCDGEILRKGLHRALIDMTLAEADRNNKGKRKAAHRAWLDAGISFHSWRHFFAAHMADLIDLRSVQLATGHKNAAMAEHYANHASNEHFKGVADAAATAFQKIIPFPKSGTSYPPGHFMLKLKGQSGGNHASRGKRRIESEIQVYGAADSCKHGSKKDLS